MHPGVPGKVNVAAQEGHDMSMKPHLNSGWIKVVPLGAPELGPGELELVCPVLNATYAGAFKEGGRANANGVPFLRDPRSDSIASVFIVASASRAAEQLPTIPQTRDVGELTSNFGINLGGETEPQTSSKKRRKHTRSW